MSSSRAILLGLNLLTIVVCSGWAACEFGWSSGSALVISIATFAGLLLPELKPRTANPDVALFQELLKDLPPEFVQNSLRGQDLGGAIHGSFLEKLKGVAKTWKDIGHEFQDDAIETKKKRLVTSLDSLLNELMPQIFPVGGTECYQVQKPTTQGEDVEHSEKIQKLNSMADGIASNYESLVRRSRKKLN